MKVLNPKQEKLVNELLGLAKGDFDLVVNAIKAATCRTTGRIDPNGVVNYIQQRTKTKKIFLICPVRDCSAEEEKRIQVYIDSLGRTNVYWPKYDTEQNDTIGIFICAKNRRALARAEEVHVWYARGSEGSLFDFGMAFSLNKKVVIANPEDIEPTPHKSFENVFLHLHTNGGRYPY